MISFPLQPDFVATQPRYLDAGEAALVVEFGTDADPALNEQVLALDHALKTRAVPGISELVPTYRSLMIQYDPLLVGRAELISLIDAILEAGGERTIFEAHLWTFPCCYDPAFAEDLPAVADKLGLPEKRIVELHAAATYRLTMYGFAPGFSYLSGLPTDLAISRRLGPRPPHPANAIIIGGGLCAIATLPMPTGWWVIGRTPESMFSAERNPVFLAAVGDDVRFETVDRFTFEMLEKRAIAGEIVARRERVGR